ncbi:MAG: RNA polymerase sigma factor [Vicinamibacterales bacterium]
MSNRRDVAEDLLEETWLRLVTHAQHLRPDTRLGPWLFTVARHLHASYRRARLLEDSHSEGLISLWRSGSPGPSPFESVEASEARQRIATALASLPATYREALWLVAVEGLRPCEAADVCGAIEHHVGGRERVDDLQQPAAKVQATHRRLLVGPGTPAQGCISDV